MKQKLNDEIVIRMYREGDLAVIQEIFLKAVHETASKDYSSEQIEAWGKVDEKRWQKRCITRPVYIAEIDSSAAGFTDLEADGHIDMMFVHPAFNRKGVASALLQQVEEDAIKANLKRLYTEASITAKPFFEAKGFEVITSQLVEIRGQRLMNYRMEKLL